MNGAERDTQAAVRQDKKMKKTSKCFQKGDGEEEEEEEGNAVIRGCKGWVEWRVSTQSSWIARYGAALAHMAV